MVKWSSFNTPYCYLTAITGHHKGSRHNTKYLTLQWQINCCMSSKVEKAQISGQPKQVFQITISCIRKVGTLKPCNFPSSIIVSKLRMFVYLIVAIIRYLRNLQKIIKRIPKIQNNEIQGKFNRKSINTDKIKRYHSRERVFNNSRRRNSFNIQTEIVCFKTNYTKIFYFYVNSSKNRLIDL